MHRIEQIYPALALSFKDRMCYTYDFKQFGILQE